MGEISGMLGTDWMETVILYIGFQLKFQSVA
jgi:hypothetical protein